MKWLTCFLSVLLSFAAQAQKTGSTTITGYGTATGSCPVAFGNGTLTPTITRSSGIAPFVVWFDATNDTNTVGVTSIGTAFQDHYYIWSFGDTGPSGSGTWGTGSNPGGNSTNLATGGIAAHMYLTQTYDQTFNIILTAFDGTNTASCVMGITAFDPGTANGWPGATTQCVGNTLPVAGANGCPASASVLQSNTIPSLNVNNKRVLFHCGDVFTGQNALVSGTKGYIGAFGSCVGTQTGRPTFRSTALSNELLTLNNPSQDIRIVDIVVDSNNQTGNGANDREAGVDTTDSPGGINAGNKPVQYTFYNLDFINHGSSVRWAAGAQMAIVNSVLDVPSQPVSGNCPPPYTNCFINLFVDYAGNGAWSSSGPIPNEDYAFIAGNTITNVAGKSLETMRNSYSVKHVISNNTMTNAGPSYANLKLHDICFATNGGTGAFCPPFYTQYDVISDNFFGGSSGNNMTEVAPQNAVTDERMRFIVFERNMMAGTQTGNATRMLELSGTQITFRDNVCPNLGPVNSGSPTFCVASFRTGIEPTPTNLEIYNNTCGGGGWDCVTLGGFGLGTAPTNSNVQNNLAFNSGGAAVVGNSGSGNTVTPNSANTTNNPAFTNGSGNLNLLTDFKPTANYAGGTSVPVWYDALGGGIPPPGGAAVWSPTWDLGAVHH